MNNEFLKLKNLFMNLSKTLNISYIKNIYKIFFNKYMLTYMFKKDINFIIILNEYKRR